MCYEKVSFPIIVRIIWEINFPVIIRELSPNFKTHHDQYNKNMLLEITSDNLQMFPFLDAETSMFFYKCVLGDSISDISSLIILNGNERLNKNQLDLLPHRRPIIFTDFLGGDFGCENKPCLHASAHERACLRARARSHTHSCSPLVKCARSSSRTQAEGRLQKSASQL